VLDADGKPGSGIKHGDIYWFGNKEECAQANPVKFRGQMCYIMTNGHSPQVCGNDYLFFFFFFNTYSSLYKLLIYNNISSPG
jgi:hypothetical protein